MGTTQRQSNIELLRILCMFFIVTTHFIGHALFPGKDIIFGSQSAMNLAKFLNGFFVVGVNCFILISGYFGVKFKLRGLLKIYLTCFFYGLLGYLCHLLIDGQHIGRTILDWSLFSLSKGQWWFVKGYIILFFCAPFLNIPINAMNKRQYIYVLILFSIINLYFGFIGGQEIYNNNGFSAAQFVYLYIIGGYIRRFVSAEWTMRNRSTTILVYVICAVVVAVLAVFLSINKMNFYNDPLVVIEAIALFLFFLSFRFQSKVVNWLSTGVLAAYLLQDHAYLGYHFIYPKTVTLFNNILMNSTYAISHPVLCEFGLLHLYSLLFLLIVLIFDHFRAWTMKPLWKIYDRVEPNILKSWERLLTKLSR